MSIADKLTTIQGNVADIADAISDKGVTVPVGAGTSDFAELIGQISAGLPTGVKMVAKIGGGLNSGSISSSYSSSTKTLSASLPSISISVDSPTAVLLKGVYFSLKYKSASSNSSIPAWYQSTFVYPYFNIDNGASSNLNGYSIANTTTRGDTSTAFAIRSSTSSITLNRPTSGTLYGWLKAARILVILYTDS